MQKNHESLMKRIVKAIGKAPVDNPELASAINDAQSALQKESVDSAAAKVPGQGLEDCGEAPESRRQPCIGYEGWCARMPQSSYCLIEESSVPTKLIEPQKCTGCKSPAKVEGAGRRWKVLSSRNTQTLHSPCQKAGHVMFTKAEAVRVWNEFK